VARDPAGASPTTRQIVSQLDDRETVSAAESDLSTPRQRFVT
jgi:hypothetical protein